jgi:hypothetical protein
VNDRSSMDCGGVLLCDCVLDDSDLLSGVSQWLLGRVLRLKYLIVARWIMEIYPLHIVS